MKDMNKVMDPMKMAKTMQEFERENEKMGMTEEMSKWFQSLLRYLDGLDVCINSFEIAEDLVKSASPVAFPVALPNEQFQYFIYRGDIPCNRAG